MQRITLNEIDFLDYREGSGGTIEIFDIAVMSERGKGVGTELIRLLQERTNTHLISAITRGSNYQARAFYRKNGFIEVRLPDFYLDEDAVLVYKRL